MKSTSSPIIEAGKSLKTNQHQPRTTQTQNQNVGITSSPAECDGFRTADESVAQLFKKLIGAQAELDSFKELIESV